MNRRGFLTAVGAGTASLAISRWAPGAQPPAPKRPNFLLIVTDDQRWDAMSVVQRELGEKGRFPWLKTPNLDRLAAEGARFRNAFVVNSLCAPSRASFLTGCYGHVNGIVNNHTPFNDNNVTWATLLGKAGYATAYVGKFHMGSQRGQRPGFDFSASFVGQGVYFDCPFEINGKPTPTQGWVDDVSTDYAMNFIRQNKDKPFAMMLGFKTGHGPFEPPPRRAKDYEGEEARPTPNLETTAIYRQDQAQPGQGGRPRARTNLGYFRAITAMDDNIGKLLALLDELNLADDTMIVFAGDNGFYFGEHGLGDKRSAYDESLRIPLVVRYPRLTGRGKPVDAMALNVDLAPTFLDYAGVNVPREMHGRSWRPVLEDTAGNWRKAFFYCYFYENGFNTPTTTAVRTETAKLIKYPGHDQWTELFDLKNDPYELKNLANDPTAASLRKNLETEYEKQAAAIAFRIPDYADDPNKDRAADPLKAWVLDYQFDKDEADKVVDASGLNNHGLNKRTSLVEGRNAHKARKFDGNAWIETPKSTSLNPAVAGWTIDVSCKAEKSDGILLARGGETNGYCLYLRNGRPAFTWVTRRRATNIVAKEAIGADWSQITVKVTTGRRVTITVNGQSAASGTVPELLRQDPNDGMQIGADTGSRVVAQLVPNFTGLVESVRVYSGEAPD